MKLFRVSVKDNTNVNEGACSASSQFWEPSDVLKVAVPAAVFDAIAEMWAKQRNAKATIPEASGLVIPSDQQTKKPIDTLCFCSNSWG